eukprot:TRINITY_DN14350_c0_g1_i1.p1 TRINITY_DN14350_c0_g1~~TRINITY_DN14350_c0_g1_i1.p1  ORF type:complete len:251 (-),score=15.86 TRINITY_DN14350_c0_g1_i1:121-801(-)
MATAASLPKCSVCTGGGWCARCKGHGRIRDAGATHITTCKACNGDAVCIHCLGHGVRLPKCGLCVQATGKCDYCGGSRRVMRPGSTVKSACPICRGSGKCRRCNGTAIIAEVPGFYTAQDVANRLQFNSTQEDEGITQALAEFLSMVNVPQLRMFVAFCCGQLVLPAGQLPETIVVSIAPDAGQLPTFNAAFPSLVLPACADAAEIIPRLQAALEEGPRPDEQDEQ